MLIQISPKEIAIQDHAAGLTGTDLRTCDIIEMLPHEKMEVELSPLENNSKTLSSGAL